MSHFNICIAKEFPINHKLSLAVAIAVTVADTPVMRINPKIVRNSLAIETDETDVFRVLVSISFRLLTKSHSLSQFRKVIFMPIDSNHYINPY